MTVPKYLIDFAQSMSKSEFNRRKSKAWADLADALISENTPPVVTEPPVVTPPPVITPPAPTGTWPKVDAINPAPTNTLVPNRGTYHDIRDTTATLSNVRLKSGIDFYGQSLLISSSIIEPNKNQWWGSVLSRSSTSTVTLNNVRILPSVTEWNMDGVQFLAGGTMQGSRVFVSNTADGMKFTKGYLEDSVIFQLNNTLNDKNGNPVHLDGVQVMGGGPVRFTRCLIDIQGPDPLDLRRHNAALFFQPYGAGNSINGVTIEDCYLRGGAYALRLEGNTNNVSVKNTVIDGRAMAHSSVQILEWSNVVDGSGKPIPRPN